MNTLGYTSRMLIKDCAKAKIEKYSDEELYLKGKKDAIAEILEYLDCSLNLLYDTSGGDFSAIGTYLQGRREVFEGVMKSLKQL